MARPPLFEIEQRKNIIADLMVRGVSSVVDMRTALAREGILVETNEESARALIRKDIKEVRIEWQQTRIANVEEALGRELAKIEKVESEAWSEYERSKENAEKVVTKTNTGTGGGTTRQETEEVAGRLGNPKYLERICWCIEKRIKLLGLENVAVINAAITLKEELNVSEMADEEIKRRLDRLLGG